MPAFADAAADLRFGLRQMARRPALYGLALLSLALALGATTALFSVASALFFLEAPGIRQPSMMVAVYTHEPEGYWSSLSSVDFRGFHEHEEIFSSLAAKLPLGVSFSSGGDPESTRGLLVSGEYFPLLGAQPALGSDPARPPDLAERFFRLPRPAASRPFAGGCDGASPGGVPVASP